jgi:hypothetical protein
LVLATNRIERRSVLGVLFPHALAIDTHPVSSAPPDVLATLPSNCPAYHLGHGKITCEWRGTIDSNPVAFYLNAGAFVACLVFPYFVALAKRGFGKTSAAANHDSAGG